VAPVVLDVDRLPAEPAVPSHSNLQTGRQFERAGGELPRRVGVVAVPPAPAGRVPGEVQRVSGRGPRAAQHVPHPRT